MKTTSAKTGLQWFIVRKTKSIAERGSVIDCVEASSLDVAFKWALEKWAPFIARSHDAGNKDAAACLIVDPMPEKREPSPIVVASADDVKTFAGFPAAIPTGWPFTFVPMLKPA